MAETNTPAREQLEGEYMNAISQRCTRHQTVVSSISVHNQAYETIERVNSIEGHECNISQLNATPLR